MTINSSMKQAMSKKTLSSLLKVDFALCRSKKPDHSFWKNQRKSRKLRWGELDDFVQKYSVN